MNCSVHFAVFISDFNDRFIHLFILSPSRVCEGSSANDEAGKMDRSWIRKAQARLSGLGIIIGWKKALELF